MRRYRLEQTLAIAGASFVTHTQVPVGTGSMVDLVIFASLYSFSGGCSTQWGSSDIQNLTLCVGEQQAETHVTIFMYDSGLDRFVHRQQLPCTGCSHVLAFSVPCEENEDAVKHRAQCQRQYLAISNRQQRVQLMSPADAPSPDAYLAQFDALSTLWVWDQHNVSGDAPAGTDGRYVEVRSGLGGGGSIPSPVTADACVDQDVYIDMLLPYGPCWSYMPEEFNQGFCQLDGVCDVCQASCALECRELDVPCIMNEAADLALHAKRMRGMWGDLQERPGILGATSMLLFEHQGEHYLSLAQGICELEQSGSECLEQAVTQPQSAILQWSGIDPLSTPHQLVCATGDTNCANLDPHPSLFDKLLAKPPSRAARGDTAHSFAMRVAAGSLSSLHAVSVPDAQGQLVVVLLASSVTEGLVSYPWVFERTVGLESVNALLAALPQPPSVLQSGLSTETLSRAPILEDSAGHMVYTASGVERRLGGLMALSRHDEVWASAPNMPARSYRGYSTTRGGPVYDSLGHLVTRLPMVRSTLFGQGVLEGTTSMSFDSTSPSLLRLMRSLPSSDLVCGFSSNSSLSELDSLPIYLNNSGKLDSHMFAWHQSLYMTGCHQLSIEVTGDSEADRVSMTHFLRHTPMVAKWGDMTIEPLRGTSGTALLRATINSQRMPASIPAGDGDALDANTPVHPGQYRLFWASVARVNQRPSIAQVLNVSILVTFGLDGGTASPPSSAQQVW